MHYHFTRDSDTSPYQVLFKPNLPYFPEGVTLVTKCKKITNDSDELEYVNGALEIPYEFTNERDVSVNLNTKFFTLYSTSNTMKLPLIYLLRYQIIAFKPNLTTNQVTKAYQQMTASLKALVPETPNDRNLINLLLNAISSEIVQHEGVANNLNIASAI